MKYANRDSKHLIKLFIYLFIAVYTSMIFNDHQFISICADIFAEVAPGCFNNHEHARSPDGPFNLTALEFQRQAWHWS